MRIKSFLIIASLILTACESKQEQKAKENPAVPVLTVTPVIKDIPVYVESIGTLRPKVLMEIRPQVGGILSEVLITEGQWVQQGTSLFKIDPKPYLIKVREAEAQHAMDTASLHEAEKKLERYRSLAEKDLMAQTEWDHIETELSKFQASVAADEAKLNTANLDLERCTLLSPVAGRVGKLDAHPGLLITAGQSTPLATISKMDPLLVEFTVTEKEFPKLPEDLRKIEIKSLSSDLISTYGEITFLDNHFDNKTGLLMVRGIVPNPDYKLRPGQSVRVRAPIATTSNAKLIPQKAVKYNQQGTYVYVVQTDNTVAFRQVVLGDTEGNDVIVREGIEPADQIITDGHLRLYPGLKVEIKP
jgi:membrane fusion protein, multidrug efflux system